MKSKVLVILGPTASGKSVLGVQLAKKFNGEVISADSRQVYKGLDIGTGKITKREMRGVVHHLLDVVSPKKKFSAGEYASKARIAIDSIAKRKKLPILVGGTGYYIDALLGRIEIPDVAPNPKLRARLKDKTASQLYALLKIRDPKRAKSMSTPSERNNKVRLIRALEIAAKKSTSVTNMSSSYEGLWIGIAPSSHELERRINRRLSLRIRTGMIAEARRLRKAGLSYKRMEELGLEYRSLSRFLKKKITKGEMVEELKRDIRRYAKKQLAYWKRNPHIKWFKPTDSKKITDAVQKWLKK